MEQLRLKTLELKNFRNLTTVSLNPTPRFNIISGLNGMGKTNLLESIYFFGALRSFRTTRRRDLIGHGQKSAVLRAVFLGTMAGLNCEISLSDNHRRFIVGSKPISSRGEHYRQLPMVLFHPATMTLVQGYPAARRRFLDRALFQAEIIYSSLHRDYMRAIENRNRVLKERPLNRLAIEAFNPLIANLGAQIVEKRTEFIERIRPCFIDAFSQISLGLRGNLIYRPKLRGGEEDFLKELRSRLKEDSARGFTSTGPHADDFDIEIDTQAARRFASQGQRRIIALCLKIAETKVLSETTGRVPILLLDDISSELDRERNKKLFEFLLSFGGQVFITTTHTDHIVIDEERSDFILRDGKIVQ